MDSKRRVFEEYEPRKCQRHEYSGCIQHQAEDPTKDVKTEPSNENEHWDFYQEIRVSAYDQDLPGPSNVSSYNPELPGPSNVSEDMEFKEKKNHWTGILSNRCQGKNELAATINQIKGEMSRNTVIFGNPDVLYNISDMKEEILRQQKHWNLCSERLLDSKMRPLLSQMNQKQKEVFNYVRDWCLKSSRGDNPEPFHLFVNGGAGVGKTYLIQCIYNEVSKILENRKTSTTVLLTAPTGTAAFKVGGFTIHTALKIPIFLSSNYKKLTYKSLEILQAVLGNLRILIIDEISMVSRVMLNYIHRRLNEIKKIGTSDKAVFGNISILAVGDFYQLAPVKAASLIIPISGQDLWHNNFEITTLEEVMRQKDDVPFAQLLNRLRQKPVGGKISEEDNAVLLSRQNLDSIPSDVLHVFTTCNKVDLHNSNMLRASCTETRVFWAQDEVLDPSRVLNMKVENGHLEYSLKLGVGARVMLIRNIDLSDGLVNGAVGTVVGFQQHALHSEPSAVYVKFDNEHVGERHKLYESNAKLDGAIAVEKREEKIKDQSVRRRQFPLKLAWACTIHKTQGMTFDRGVIDLEGISKPGQAYVGLSRVTNLNGLFLRNYKSQRIYMEPSVHANIRKMKCLSIPVFLEGSSPMPLLQINHPL